MIRAIKEIRERLKTLEAKQEQTDKENKAKIAKAKKIIEDTDFEGDNGAMFTDVVRQVLNQVKKVLETIA